MRAVTWQGNEKMEVKTVPDPTIEEPTDMIVRITATAICGSDLHLYHNGKPVMEKDYVVGHEPMGIVEEVGSAVTKVKKATESLSLSTLVVESVISVLIIWKVNVTIPTIIQCLIKAGCSVLVK